MAKILLVEDDNNLREIYEARLQAEGYEIVTARDGEEALVVAKKEAPDLIISDVMMPRISGFEMLDILRNTPGLKEVKVIMLTALGQAEDKTRAEKLGADRYLVKSQVTLEDIVKSAAELLGLGNPSPTLQDVSQPNTPLQPLPNPAAAPALARAASPAMPTSSAVPRTTTTTIPMATAPIPPITSAPTAPPNPAVPGVVVVAPPVPSVPGPVPASPPTSEDTLVTNAVNKLVSGTAQEQAPHGAASTPPGMTTLPPTVPISPVPVVPTVSAAPVFTPPAATAAPAFIANPVAAPRPPVPTPAPVTPVFPPAAPPPPPIPAPPAPSVPGPVPTAPVPTPVQVAPPQQPVTSMQDTGDGISIPRKRTIQPLPQESRETAPDLNTLLAKEGITSMEERPGAPNAAMLPHPPGHVISPNPTNAQGKPVDPGSISL